MAMVGAACGSSGSGSKSTPDKQSTTTVSGGSGSGGGTTTAPATSDMSSVQWVPEMGTGTETVTWTKDKKFDPASISVKVGDIVEFKAEAGASIAAIGPNQNGDDAKTLTPGMSESFKFTKPGKFTLYEEMTKAPFTVTVSS
ncbi:MAG: hypothetical protein JST73_06730 [Actinobacteria bacterium]|nr:hypothetical protein [Actinomycetota bacterium]